jgi:hypothetical protein
MLFFIVASLTLTLTVSGIFHSSYETNCLGALIKPLI